MKTLAEALSAGYTEVGTALMRGYVTRKPRSLDAIDVHAAGGSRKGLLYYAAPNWGSTRYCVRVYLASPSGR